MSIELRSRRGAVGTSWHAVALRDGAERLLGAARVSRGKADARAGRVQWLDVDAGVARGDVLDPEGELHQARLELPAFRPDDRRVVMQVAQSHPELPARLAAGEYPQQIEAELARSEVSLLPRDATELSHDCSCLDWPGPCRHVSALLYVLVEAVDAQPLLLLTLRGLTLEDLVAPRAAPRAAADGAAGTASDAAASGDADGIGAEEPGTQGSGTEGAGTERSGTERSGAAGSGAERPGSVSVADPAPPAVYDPERTDPSRLADVAGEEVAAVIHSFYTRST